MSKNNRGEPGKKPAKTGINTALEESGRPGKEQAAKYLARVPAEFVFWSHDGSIYRDLKDLEEAFELMSEDTYFYHANTNKNDFSCWIRDIMGDDELAKNLEKASNKGQAAAIVAERYAFLCKFIE
jgi:hypothetical protein